MMRYRPGDVAPQLKMPVLVAVGEFDRETEQADAALIADRAPHGVLRRYPSATSTSTGRTTENGCSPTRSDFSTR